MRGEEDLEWMSLFEGGSRTAKKILEKRQGRERWECDRSCSQAGRGECAGRVGEVKMVRQTSVIRLPVMKSRHNVTQRFRGPHKWVHDLE